MVWFLIIFFLPFSVDDDPPDIQFQPHGYLFLATEAGVDTMVENHKIQK